MTDKIKTWKIRRSGALKMTTNYLYRRMYWVALNAHKGQTDRAGVDYFQHVLKVVLNLNSFDDELNSIAILHDIIEDTDVTYDDLYGYGATDRIVDALRCLTKIDGQTNDEYLERILSNHDAILVKIADLEHNMDVTRLKKLSDKDLERLKKYHSMYRTLLKARDEKATNHNKGLERTSI